MFNIKHNFIWLFPQMLKTCFHHFCVFSQYLFFLIPQHNTTQHNIPQIIEKRTREMLSFFSVLRNVVFC